MPKFFINETQINNDMINIIGEDVKHISNVLRANIGDEIRVCNTDCAENYLVEIVEISKESINCKIKKKLQSDSESNIKVSIFQGLPKADKMELIIQKSIELGAKDITPVRMERCVVKIDSKDVNKKIERWQKIAEMASKQSGRDIIPKINNIVCINDIKSKIKEYDAFIIAYENEKDTTLKHILKSIKIKDNLNIAILIGPEGGIDKKEIDILQKEGAKVITLGKRILRTETVALAVTSMIIYEFEGDE